MKATIDHAGLMTIEPETPLEAYAIGQWAKNNFFHQGNVAYWRSEGMVISADCGKVGSPFPSGEQER